MGNEANGNGSQNANWTAPEHDRTQIVLDSMLPVERLFDRGRTFARTSGIVEERPEDIQMLTEYAQAVARDTHVEDYDPTKHHQDRLRDLAHNKDVGDCKEAELVVKYANAEVRERDVEVAKLKAGIEEPQVSAWTFVFAVTVLALSISPTLHDRFFFTVRDQVLAWFFAALGALVVGAFISWALVGSIDATGRRTGPNIIGLLAGIGIGVAIGILRMADAHSLDQYVFAIGLTLLEISCVVALEWLASNLRARYSEWTTYKETLNKANAVLQAAISNENRCKKELEMLQTRIAEHLRYVESRWVRHNKVSEIEGSCVNGSINGYRQGIAENLGRIRGLREVS